MGTHPTKDKANENTNRHNLNKNKSKQSTNIQEIPYAKRTNDYEMTIMIKKIIQDNRTVMCHKSANDKKTLTMMCKKDKEPQPNATAH